MMDGRALLMGLGFALMWSSAFTSAKIIVAGAPPLAALSIRFLIAGVIALAIGAFLGQSARLDARQWRIVIIFGICQNVLYLGCNFVAMQRLDASVAAIVASALPLLVALFGALFLGARLTGVQMAGLVAGFAGVLIVMLTRLGGGLDALGLGLCVIGVLALTAATLVLRGTGSNDNILMVVGLQMLVGGTVLLVPALLFEAWVITPSWPLALAFTYTIFVPGLLATWLWFVLVRRIGGTRAAVFHFLNPFIGVAIAALILGEPFGARDILGVSVIMAGILAVQLGGRGLKEETRP